MRVSIVVPAYNEAANLPTLYARIRDVFAERPELWQLIVVDDHSADETFAVASRLAAEDGRVRAIRFARNAGSHAAILCGLAEADGDCAVVLAADLQDPPETIPELLARWQSGARIVWAVRAERLGESRRTLAFSRFYYWLMRRVAGVRTMPETGADFFLIDRLVIDALAHFQEVNTSLFALLCWMGYRQDSITYTKEARLHGSSGWSLEKKIKLVVDSLTAFSYTPIRAISIFGISCALLGFLYAAFIVLNAFAGRPIEGWSSLMVAVLVLGGAQMLMLGVLGEYLWRALDESRHRPRFLVEARTEARVPTEGRT